ncbi:hypothetical protein NPIL_670441 [Nephila pilipes]|uniref:Uncharacterized protein n=1 Tax=Nephila pilipes TaxID=299642 RepID=A0A8X6PH78_NEPPI|nr:hypothetical protein NPIL_670441 [Nephila pilipes]
MMILKTVDKKWIRFIKDSSVRSHWRKIDLGTGVLCRMPLMFESHPFLNETVETSLMLSDRETVMEKSRKTLMGQLSVLQS